MEGRMFLALMAVALVGGSLIGSVEGAATLTPEGLKRNFYKKTNTCASAEVFIRHQVKLFYKYDKSLPAKLLRLLYSDCMVTGCDGSILLDGPDTEIMAPQNVGLRAFIVIDKIKQVLEAYCPGAVSCADILMIATRDAVALAGGPSYIVLTGRRDGMSSKASSVDLPSPDISLEDGLKYFKSRNLNVQDYSTLLGAHSLGKARCRFLRNRLYNFRGTGKPDPDMDNATLEDLRAQCPQKQKPGEHEGLVYLNKKSGDTYRFTNAYYTNILSGKAVLAVDQEQFRGNDTVQLTEQFADPYSGFNDFKKSFALSMNRMGTFNVLTGKQGEVRKHCRYTNAANPYIHH